MNNSTLNYKELQKQYWMKAKELRKVTAKKKN